MPTDVHVHTVHCDVHLSISQLSAFSWEFCEQLRSRRKSYTTVTDATTSSHYFHSIADIYAAKVYINTHLNKVDSCSSLGL